MWKRRSRDIILRAYSGDYRISAIIAQKSVKEAASRWNHAVDSVANRIWGEYMVGAMMLNSFYKGEERIKVSVVSNEIHQLYVETMSIGEVDISKVIPLSCMCYSYMLLDN
jgi:redox-regulated HSP33 family molecular chaperone